jgi:hypothetical protein
LLFDKKRFQVANNLPDNSNEEFDSPSLSNYLDENLAQDEFNDEVSNGMVAYSTSTKSSSLCIKQSK